MFNQINQRLRLIPLALITVIGAGCTQMPENDGQPSRVEQEITRILDEKGLVRGEELSSVNDFMLNGFTAFNEYSLSITSGVRDRYLLTLAGPCVELPFATSIGFQAHGLRLTPADSVLVNSFSRRTERCLIDRIYRLENKAVTEETTEGEAAE